MASARFASQVRHHADPVEVSSAGIRARDDGMPTSVPEPVLEVMGTYGIDLRGHESRALTATMLEETDLVIGTLLFGGCLAWQRSRDWLAAFLWGAAAAFKCTPLLLAAYLLWRGRWAPAIALLGLAIPVAEDAPTGPPAGATEDMRDLRFQQLVVDTERRVLDSCNRPTILRYPLVYGPRNHAAKEWSVVKRVLDGRAAIQFLEVVGQRQQRV